MLGDRFVPAWPSCRCSRCPLPAPQIAGKCGGQNCLNVTNLPPSQRNAAAGGEACAEQSTLTGFKDCENVTKWKPNAPSELVCGAG